MPSNNGFWSVKFNYRRATRNPMWTIFVPCGPFCVEQAQKIIGGSELSPLHYVERRHAFLVLCAQPSHRHLELFGIFDGFFHDFWIQAVISFL
jgi:hypothetical protein